MVHKKQLIKIFFRFSGAASLQASVLSELALKQEKEREKLLDLLYGASHNQSIVDWCSQITPQVI